MEPRLLLSVTQVAVDVNQFPASISYKNGVVWDDKLYFSGGRENLASSSELWRYDPEANGGAGDLTQVANIFPGAGNGDPGYLTILGDKLYFSATDGVHGRELWQYDLAAEDGAAAFNMVADIRTGSGSSNPMHLRVVGDKLYFAADDGIHGIELWQYDPVANNGEGSASLAADIHSGSGSSSINYLTEFDGQLYFRADDGISGHELWRFDPTANDGTGAAELVADIQPGSGSSQPGQLAALAGKLYFSANDGVLGNELWEYDPNSNEATLVADINSGSGSSSPSYLTEFEGKLYFNARDEINPHQLWEFDPEADGTGLSMITQFAGSFGASHLQIFDGDLYFSADDGTLGRELWRYDPQAGEEALKLVADINIGSGASSPSTLTPLGGKLYFSADDGIYGRQLWRYDPNAGDGDGEVVRMAETVDGTGPSYPFFLTALNGKLYFRASDAINGSAGSELWEYDPAANEGAGAAVKVTDIFSGNTTPHDLIAMGGKIYFRGADPDHGAELWQYDPTPGGDGATMVADIQSGPIGSVPQSFAVVDDKLYFSAVDGIHGFELWRYDPEANEGNGGVSLVADVVSGAGHSHPQELTELDGKLYFTANHPDYGREVWEYDPNAEGGIGAARLLADIRPGSSTSSPSSLAAFDGKLYFAANDGIHGSELWQYDPAAEGGAGAVSLVVDIVSGSGSSNPGGFTGLNGKLYFSANDGTHGWELWQYDPEADGGTGAATMVADIASGSETSYPRELTALGGRLYFVAETAEFGTELWQYDPNAQGGQGEATLAADVLPGSISSLPNFLTVLDGRLYFAAWDEIASREIVVFTPPSEPTTISGDTSGNTNEDAIEVVTGLLTIENADPGEAFFVVQTDTVGDYGLFSIDTQGNWSYTLENASVQHLGTGEIVEDHFTVTSLDGTASQDVVITINGLNDAPTALIVEVSEFRIAGNEIIVTGSAIDPDHEVTALNFHYQVFQDGSPEPVSEQSGVDLTLLSFTPESAGSYEVRLTVSDPEGAFDIAMQTIEVGTASQVAMIMAAESVPLGTVANEGSGPAAIFHEWEDVTGELWFTIGEDLPADAHDFTFSVAVPDIHLADPQLQSHLGTGSTWGITVEDDQRVATATLEGLDLSEYEVGDRVLIATIYYPRDLDDLVGIPIDQQGAYGEPNSDHGVALLDAGWSETSQVLSVVAPVAGQFVPVIYDTDDNGRVGLSDFIQFISSYGQVPGLDSPDAYRFDFDRGGRVGLSDFLLFIQHYGASKDSDRSINMPFLDAYSSQGQQQSMLEGEPNSESDSPGQGDWGLIEGEPHPESPAIITPLPTAEKISSIRVPNDIHPNAPAPIARALDPRLIDAVWRDEATASESQKEDEEDWLGFLVQE